jgi:D-alanyl-D-alanine carboxypeptidase (penicillin-binding protein 5/6)
MKKNKKIISAIIIIFIVLFNFVNVYATEELNVDAKAAIIVERNTGKIIYEKEAQTKNYPASVTKILTAILAIENCKLDDVATVSQTAISNIPTEYIVAPLKVGEEIKIEDLLYALMLKSANDAAYVLAEHMGGSVEGFANMMNKKAEEIGCKGTHFVNPNGIHNENHYTTAYDLYLISDYAMKNETFAKIVSTYSYTLSATNKYPNKDRVMKNTNEFINPNSGFYNKSVKGIKTGTTLPAGNCLITDASEDGLDFIMVVLGATTSNAKFNETSEMMGYAFNNYTNTKVHNKGDIIKTIEVEKAKKNNKTLNLVISNEIISMHNKEINANEVEPEIILNENIKAPITAGQELGTVKYSIDGLTYEAKLLAEKDIPKRTYEKEILIAIIVFLIIIFFMLVLKKKKRRKKRRITREIKYER